MKKMLKNFAAFAGAAFVAVSLTACHHNDAAGAEPAAKTQVTEIKTTNTLVVNLTTKNNAALPAGIVVKYAGITGTISGKQVTFENAPASGTLTLTGGSVIPQSADIAFNDRNLVVMDLFVAVESAGQVIPTTATPSDVSDTDNLDDGASSTITLPAAAISNNPALKGKNFSVTMIEQAVAPLTSVAPRTLNIQPYALSCKPEGQNFNPNVSMKAEMPGLENTTLAVQDPQTKKAVSTLSGSTLSADIPHFSIWPIVLNIKITEVTEDKEKIAEGSLTAGVNTVSYKEWFGFTGNFTGVVNRIMRCLFGTTATQVSKTAQLKAEGDATYVIYQRVQNVTLTSGSQTFKVKIYGGVYSEVTQTPSAEPVVPVVPTHNGGGND